MKNLRHSSLHSNVFSMYQRFQAYYVHSKGDMYVQKIKVKKYIFVYSYPNLLNQDVYFHITYIPGLISLERHHTLFYMF